MARSFGYRPRATRAPRISRSSIPETGCHTQESDAPQIALAWLLARKPWIVPIPGTTKRDRLAENLGAVSIDLTPEELHEIDAAASKIELEGVRLPEAVLQYSNR